jgi:hypothetical protein
MNGDKSTDNWNFVPFTFRGETYYPNNWRIVRENGVAAIKDEHNNLIDEPEDKGQSDLELIIWGIGWMHAQFLDDCRYRIVGK